ncbi:MAG: PAS domain S-box protein [Pseudomonadota bacterium]
MEYQLSELFAGKTMQKVLDGFCDAMGIASAVIDLEGKVLIGSRWQSLCTDFHRVHPETRKRCIESDTYLANRLNLQKTSLYTCRNGLTDAAAPIFVEGRHIANFFVGQFVTEPPDIDFFRNQAVKFGFDQDAYLKALACVPVVNPERLGPILEFLSGYAEMLGTMGLERMRQLQITQQLKTSSEQLQLALDGSDLGIWDWNLKTGRAKWDGRAVGILGFSVDEVEHDFETWKRQVHPEDRPRVYGVFIEHLKDKTPFFEMQYRLKDKSGVWKWVSARGMVVERDPDGKALRMAGTILDITDRKRTEEAFAESELRFRSTFEQAAVGICHVSPEGRFLRVNHKLCDILGYTQDELLGLTFQDVTHPDDLEADLEYVGQVLAQTIDTYSMEKRYIRKDGSHFWAALTVSLNRDSSGSPQYFISVVEDISDRKNAEHALRLSEERYRAMFANMKSGVAVYEAIDEGEDFMFTDFNRAAELISRIAKEEVVGRRLLEKFPRMDKFGLPAALQSVYRTGQPRHLPAAYYKDEFREGWRENFIYKLPSGEVVAMYEDVTDRKRSEEALRDSERRFRTIYELAPVMIHSIDRNAIIRNVNRKWIEELGYGRDQVVGKQIDFLMTPGSRVRLHKILPHYWREGRVSDIPYQYIKNDGRVIDVLLDSVAVSDGEWGEVSISVVRNITEQKQAEEALRQSESTLRTLIQTAPIGIGVLTGDLSLGWTNQLLCRMLDYSREEITGRNARILFESDEEFLRVARIAHPDMGNRGTGTVETRLRNKDGACFDVLFSSSIIVPGDFSQGLVFTVMDMTERKKLEEQLLRSQKMQALGTLSGGIAHDFNNLLQVIQGYADLALLKRPQDQAPYPELREIKSAAQSAAELTQGLLTFSRRVESSLRVVDLNREIDRAVRILRRTIPKMIDIELRLHPGLKPVMGDPAQLQQVVINLAVNARDAMKDVGCLVIETDNVLLVPDYCKTHVGTRPGYNAVLTVSDTGCGMTREVAGRIFEPFFTTKDLGKGTGLGLAIVYGIVENHRGSITCRSEPGRGTTFKIFLPVCDRIAPDDEPAMQNQPPVGGSETILLVDDEASVRKLGRELLSKFGYTVLTASNGEEGLEVFRKERHRIDLVVLDLIMPHMGGRECLNEIMKIAPSTRVLIASGHAADGQIDASLAEGAKASLPKPYGSSQLLETVRRLLDEG